MSNLKKFLIKIIHNSENLNFKKRNESDDFSNNADNDSFDNNSNRGFDMFILNIEFDVNLKKNWKKPNF